MQLQVWIHCLQYSNYILNKVEGICKALLYRSERLTTDYMHYHDGLILQTSLFIKGPISWDISLGIN